LGYGDREDRDLRPAQQMVCEIAISKITKVKWIGGVTQAVEFLLCKHKEALSSNPGATKKIIIKPLKIL
jgi:hypothetical protein